MVHGSPRFVRSVNAIPPSATVITASQIESWDACLSR